jgi:hypothetical protein
MNEVVTSIKEILIGYIEGFGKALPGFFVFIAILLIGWIIAKISSKTVAKLLEKIKVDQLLLKLNLNELFGNKDFSKSIISVISKFVYYFIFLIAISTAIESLRMQVLTDLIIQIIEFFPKVLVAAIIFVFGFYLATFIRDMISSTTRSLGMASGGIFGNVIFYFLIIMVSVLAIEQLGIDASLITDNITILIAGVIISGALAYGLAAVDTMGNILAIFFAKKTFAVGQYIRIGDLEGQIVEINSVNITLAKKGQRIIIPAKQFTKENVIISVNELKEIDE